MANDLVDTEPLLRQMLDNIANIKINDKTKTKPFLFIDLEGVRLSRNGAIAIMQILAPPSKTVHLVDVHVLKDKAFNTKGTNGTSLKMIFESDEYTKVFFDVRGDSDALFGQFGVDLHGVVDLQLMEFATRRGYAKYVCGLSKCIQLDAGLDFTASSEWQRVKEAGKKLFAPEQGGTYEVFLERPLAADLVEYCKQDVLFMPKLLLRYGSRMSGNPYVAMQVLEESERRVALSQSATFQNNGQNMAVGPHISRYGSVFTNLTYPMDITCSGRLTKFCTFKIPDKATSSPDIDSELVLLVSAMGASTPSSNWPASLQITKDDQGRA